jgi:hypothetical protein
MDNEIQRPFTDSSGGYTTSLMNDHQTSQPVRILDSSFGSNFPFFSSTNMKDEFINQVEQEEDNNRARTAGNTHLISKPYN